MKEFFNSVPGQIIRWVFILPASAVAFIICTAIVSFFLYLGSSMDWGETWLSYIFRILISNGVGGFGFVFFGASVAPSLNKEVSIILAILFSSLNVLLLFGAFSLGILFIEGMFEGWIGILGVVSSIIGSGYASFIFLSDEQDNVFS